MSEPSQQQYSQQQYSENNFWEKITVFARFAGKEVVERALTLFLAAQRPETPVWAKTVIYSALAYFILPTDAVPDFIPFTGYVDDLGTLIAALSTVTMSITPEVKETAKQQVTQWFGEDRVEASDPNTPQAGDTIREISID